MLKDSVTSTVCEDSTSLFINLIIVIIMKNKIYTTISIVGLIGIMCFIIYLVANFIYFGVYEINEISDNTNIDNTCINTNVNQYNDSSRPVKGMKYKDSIDSLAFSKHIDLSSIDGDNFYSREINEGLTSGRVYK